MPFKQVRDIDIYYEIAGSGPRLLYISGTGADLRNKPNIFDSPLANEFEILAFDQRACRDWEGLSREPSLRERVQAREHRCLVDADRDEGAFGFFDTTPRISIA